MKAGRRQMREVIGERHIGGIEYALLSCGHQVPTRGDWRQKRRCRACEREAALAERRWLRSGESEFCRRVRLSMGMPGPATNNQGG